MTTTAPDVLQAIVAAARRITDVRRERVPESALEKSVSGRGAGRDFSAALRAGTSPRVIAECKRRSPSRGILRQNYEPAAHARAYAGAGAAAISVLTEPTFFDGALEHLQRVRAAVEVPLLRKDFIVTRYQILEAAAAGADAVLLIVGALSLADLERLIREATSCHLDALVEAHDENEVALAVDAGARIIGVNSRNLRTLEVDAGVHERVLVRMPHDVVAVAESGLRSRADLDRLERAGYHAFLVGERLIGEADPGAALRTLREGSAR